MRLAIATAALISAPPDWSNVHIRSDYHFCQISNNKLNKSRNAFMTKARAVCFAAKIVMGLSNTYHYALTL
jgi:hypothetical protein